MEQNEVIHALILERKYQEIQKQNPERPDIIPDLHMGDMLSAIQYNLEVARIAWYKEAVPYEKTMEYLRKIGALCIQAGETYGMTPRKIECP